MARHAFEFPEIASCFDCPCFHYPLGHGSIAECGAAYDGHDTGRALHARYAGEHNEFVMFDRPDWCPLVPAVDPDEQLVRVIRYMLAHDKTAYNFYVVTDELEAMGIDWEED